MGGAESKDVKTAVKQGVTSHEFYREVKCRSEESSLCEYYKIQSLQSLGKKEDQVSVPIWIARDQRRCSEFSNVEPAWMDHLECAIKDINYAAPGLGLHIANVMATAKVKIYGNKENACYTMGNILRTPTTEIRLCDWWEGKKGTSCHELLHALGFGHEHQRRDRDSSVQVRDERLGEKWKRQYRCGEHMIGMARFDPHSVMMYPEDQDMMRNSRDPVWFTKPTTERNTEMSELDKICLNNLYRSCTRLHYSPTMFGRGITGLFYCGRYFGVQCPGHDGYCGPTNGPNCPACRVLKTDRVVSLWNKGKWQGWTGGVYCGRNFGVQCDGHNGCCGPNNGPQCPECYDELLRGA